jgi:hypothetical protein
MIITDTHTHIQEFGRDQTEMIQRAIDAGVFSVFLYLLLILVVPGNV